MVTRGYSETFKQISSVVCFVYDNFWLICGNSPLLYTYSDQTSWTAVVASLLDKIAVARKRNPLAGERRIENTKEFQ